MTNAETPPSTSDGHPDTIPAGVDPHADRLLDAALPHVPFDGWTEAAFRKAARDAGVERSEARLAFPRGGIDLALAFQRRGDARMAERLRAEDVSGLKFRDRVARAVRLRIEAIGSREAARRAAALFALPHHAAEGARALWGTADAIWRALDDTSVDLNWYTKRATLSGVYASTLLFWLGDDSLDCQDTWGFLDRRIEDVMRIERAKAQVNGNPMLRTLFAGPTWLAGRIRAPGRMDLPGRWPASGE